MLQKISNIKKLFQQLKPEANVSVTTVYGTRCILHVANLALFGVVIMLTVASALIYYLMPITDVSELSKMIVVQEVETDLETESPATESVDADSKKEVVVENETFSVINERNVFSHKRKEWVVKAIIPKSSELKNKKKVRADLAKKALAKKKAQAGKPKKIILHGVVIAGDLKKALINNPLKGVSKKKTLYVEVGDELDGYKVTSIEEDRIRLDWHGEEIVIMLYSGLKGFKQGASSGRVKPGGLTKLDYKFKVVEDDQAEEGLDVGDAEDKKVAHADTLDETSLNLEYEEPEYFSMPTFDDTQLSESFEIKGVAEKFPDVGFNDVDFSEEEQETVTTLDYKFKVVEDPQAEENFDVSDTEVKKVAHADTLDETSLNLVYKEPEFFSMPAFDDVQLSETVEMKMVAEMFPDIKSKDVAFSEERYETVRSEIPKSVDLVTEEGIKQKSLSGKPSEILLHGIVIVVARDIKKALVNIPMSDLYKDRTLYVEEGDRLEGYKVTSIEPDLLRLDWHGKEMIVKFPLL